MPDSLFRGIFDTASANVIAPGTFLLCVGTSLLLGFLLAVLTRQPKESTGSFAVTLALLPAAVCAVIMMVNGNVGTGVAVAGAFGLVRFRSAPGTAREIGSIFLAMTIGLMTGMGYLAYAALFTLIMGGMTIVFTAAKLGTPGNAPAYRQLRITIPESLDYAGIFDPVLSSYADRYSLVQVKTSDMGSLFKLTYDLELADPGKEKALLDDLRCRNGNLEISLSYQPTQTADARL